MSIQEARLLDRNSSDKAAHFDIGVKTTPKIVSSHSFNSLSQKPHRPYKSKTPFPAELNQMVNGASVTPNSNLNNKKINGNSRLLDQDDDLQNTLKKIPKISKKLPAAFNNSFQKSAQNISKKVMANPFQSKNDILANLDSIIEAQEYKQTSALLSPLKNKGNLKKIKDSTDFLRSRHESVSRNPLGPLKSYIMLQKLNSSDDQMDPLGNTSLENIDLPSRRKAIKVFSKESLDEPQIKLDQMITISVMKSAHESGVIKKMLHAPTLKLYAVKEVPLSNREMRNNLKSWLNSWESEFEDSSRHLKVYSVFFNQPEGCVSIVMELINGGSVQNLLESAGNLPEGVISHVAGQALHSLNELHEKMVQCHGVISPSQFLIDKAGNIKLSLGIASKTQTGNNYSNTLANTFGRNNQDKLSLYELNPINNPTLFQRQFFNGKEGGANNVEQTKQQYFNQDVFDFGFLMLICAVGGLDFFESSDFLDKVKIFLDELGRKPQERSKYCCLIHDEELIANIKLPDSTINFQNIKPTKVAKANGIVLDNTISRSKDHISIKSFLKAQKFSKEFESFLCKCLKFDPTKRATINALLKSSFLRLKDFKGPNVDITELLKISEQFNRNSVLPAEYQGASDRQLKKLCQAIPILLPGIEKPSNYPELYQLRSDSQQIKELASDLGVSVGKVFSSLRAVLKKMGPESEPIKTNR